MAKSKNNRTKAGKKTVKNLKKSKRIQSKKLPQIRKKITSQTKKVRKKSTPKTSRPDRVKFLASGLAVLIGINLVAAGFLFKAYQATVLSFTASPVVITKSKYRPPAPTQLLIKDINLDLKIVPTQIQNGVWQIATDGASYLDSSSRPQEGGNIVIYGHNTGEMFGKLKFVDIGSIITLVNQESQTISYQVISISITSPDEIEYVLPKDHEVLTLYTCTGFLDSQRLVVVAEPI